MTIKQRVKKGVVTLAIIGSSAANAQQFITIGTGSVTGVYYPSGSAICKLVNQSRQKHNIRCSVESSEGSIANVNAIREGQLDFGIVQSDWQFHAYQGTSEFEKYGEYKELRAIFSLHSESFNIIANKTSGIEQLKDIEGKRVNIGNPGSGDLATMNVVMDQLGWTNDSFQQVTQLKGSKRSLALCENKIDAFIYLVGHPNGSIKEAMTSCDAKLIPATGPEIQSIVEHNPYYTYTKVKANTYSGLNDDVESFGVAATLVTSAKVSDQAAYTIAKAVFENFDAFKQLHPAFSNLNKADMIKAGLSAPLHPGAEKYYKEIGLLVE